MELRPDPVCAAVYLCPRMKLSAPDVERTIPFPRASSSVCLNQARRVVEQARLALSGTINHPRTAPGPAVRTGQVPPGEVAGSRVRGPRIRCSEHKISLPGLLNHCNRMASARIIALTAQGFSLHHPRLWEIFPKIPINQPIPVTMLLPVEIFSKARSVLRSVPFYRQHSKISLKMATAACLLWHPHVHPG